ncbi:MAG: discoidin domain-containing protein [Lentisphaeria bacterium]|nr:discoidin domain-containing protein [Lentisphaeria bacterium]
MMKRKGYAMFSMLLCGAMAGAATPRNLALGKSYTLSDRPNYSLCTDGADAVQLTDGKRTEGKFWTQKTTVGWSSGGLKGITIDLGDVHSIGGVLLSTAGGVAGVHWPTQIQMFVSTDGREWHPLGDLIVLSSRLAAAPKYGEYATHEFRTDALKTHGRFVKFLVDLEELYFFCDEIEIHEGDPAFLSAAYEGTPVTDVMARMRSLASMRPVKEQLRRDLVAATDDLAKAKLAEPLREALTEKANTLVRRIDTMPDIHLETFRAVLPMNALERDIFRFQAEVWRAEGKAAVRLWKTHRWDPLAPSQEPSGSEPGLAVNMVMMQNETRADVLNITNAAAQDLVARVRIEGLPGGTGQDGLTVHEVTAVGTRRFVAVSAALPIARQLGPDWLVTIPSGMTRQLWFSCDSAKLAPGDHTGRILLRNGERTLANVPIHVRVAPIRFPDQSTLNLGGWAYTDLVGAAGITSKNRDALVKMLQEHGVNAPWATNGIMPTGTFDPDGTFVEPPDTVRFDAFVALWPGARHYMVFIARGGSPEFAGSKPGTPLFQTKVATWIRFWADHFRSVGLKPEQVGLLLVDEPESEKKYNILLAYARVINRVEPEITLWLDPRVSKDETCMEALDAMDVLVPHRPGWMQWEPWVRDTFHKLGSEGKQLGFYSAAGPARTFDPYSYYLLQQWHCYQIGGNWAGFWAFGGDASFSVWNEYATQGYGSYCPMFLDDDGVTTAKYMEAIREGVQDYEYLVMLRARIARVDAAGDKSTALAGARKLLANACSRVLEGGTAQGHRWDEPKDRSVADTVRLQILDALADLK